MTFREVFLTILVTFTAMAAIYYGLEPLALWMGGY